MASNKSLINIIAEGQAQQLKNNQLLQQTQADYDAWLKSQPPQIDDGYMQQVQADYDAWLNSQPQPTPQPTVQKSQSVQQIPSIKTKAPTPDLSTWFSPKSASGRDINKEAAAKITNDVQKKKEANTYGDLDSALESLAQQKGISTEEAKRIYDMGSGKAQITSRGDSVYNRKAAEDMLNQERMQKYLDPNKKLTEQEKRQAREVARKVLDSYELRSGGVPVLDNEKDRQLYADATNLLNKTSKVANFSEGFLDPYLRVAKTVRDTVVPGTDKALEGIASVSDNLGITDNAKEKALGNIAQRQTLRNAIDESNKKAVQNATTQNPWITTGGKFAGNVSQYMLTNPLFDGAAAALGASSRAGKFLVNQLGQNAQDMVLDTLPTLKEYLSDGNISEEEKNNLVSGMLWNAGGNLVPGLIGEGVTSYKNAKAAKKALEGADDIVEAATKQAEEAAQNIDDIAKQMPEQSTTTIKKSMNKAPNKYPEGKMYIDDSNDINDILLSGNRDNKKRLKAFNEGKKVSIANRDELKEFLFGDNSNYFDTVTFGKVSDRLADEINNTSKGKFDDLYGAYLDIEKGHSGHSINNHSIPKDPGDMPLKEEDLLAALENTNNAKVLDTKKYNSGDRTVTLALPTTDGHVIMIETVSKSRGSLLYRNGWVVDNQKFIDNFLRSNPNSAEGVNPTAVRDGIAPYKENITDAIENVNKKSVNKFNVPDESFEQIDSYFTELARPMNEVQRSGFMDTVTDKKAVEEWQKLNEAYSDYLNKSIGNADINEVEAAKKVLDNTRKRYARAMKDINPEISKQFGSGSYGYKIGRPLNVRNNLLKTEENARETVDLINDLENYNKNAKEKNSLQFFGGDNEVPEPNYKVSEAYTNTGKRGGGWNADEYAKHTKENNFLYESIDEEKSIEQANKMRAEEGREAFKNRALYSDRLSGSEIDGLMMEWRDLTKEARELEAAGKRADTKWIEANTIFRKIQEQSTSNAQALQALAKWSRNTPEGMLVNAENIVNGKTKVPQTKLQEALNKFSKGKKKDFHFSDEFMKDFLETAKPLEGLTGDQLDTKEAKEIMAKLGKMVNEQLPVKFSEKLTTYLMDNMLGNFRTLITRNAGGNIGLNAMEQLAERPLAAGIDSLVSLKTGRRTQAGLSREALSNYIQGFKKGIADELSDFKTGLHTARSGENTLENAISSNRHVFKSKVADGLDGLVRHGLSVGDRPFYEGVYKQTLGDYQNLRARGLMGDVVQNMSDADFKLFSETAAKLNALAAVYQQDTLLSEALMGFKKDIGKLSDGILGVDVLSQFSMPFVKTPANVIERAIDYSPLGAFRNAFRTGRELKNGVFDQNRFVNETARNILGTGLMGGGVALAANGAMSGSYSDNKNKKQAQKDSGMQEYAWNVPEQIPGIGGKQMDISWAPVVGSNLVASAAAYDSYKNGKGDKIGNIGTGLKAGGQALFDQSMFQGLQRLFGSGESYNSDEGIVGNMSNVVKSGAGQFIPSLVRQVAQVKDPYQRDLGGSNKDTSFGPFGNYDINSLANNIPELRENYLAPKVDTSGELVKENQGRNLGMKVLEDMILPGKLTEIKSDKLTEEANRLSEATSNSTAYIPKADRNALDTEEHTLTNEEWVDYQQKYYKELNSAGNKLIDSDFYKGLGDVEKEATLSNVYKSIKAAINSEYTGKEVDGAAKKYLEAGGGEKGIKAVIDHYNAKNITDSAGINANSKAAQEVQEAVQSGNTDKAQKIANEKEKELDLYEQYGLENNSMSQKVYKDYGETGLKDLGELKKEGAGNAVYVYQSAKNDVGAGNIPSIKEFATNYKKMDSYGDSNGTVSQKEFAAYLDANNYTEDQAKKLATIYGDWTKQPYKNKNGKWSFKK